MFGKEIRGLLVGVVVASAFLGTGCASIFSSQQGDEAAQAAPPWLQALYPVEGEEPVRVERYETSIGLVRGGQLYGSNRVEEIPGQVVGMLAGLALAPDGPTLRRVGQIGFGTGTSIAVALGAGSRTVDVFERDGHIVAAAEVLATKRGIVYRGEDPRPIHPALRLVTPAMVEEEQYLRYDVLVSPPATSTIARPTNLLTVERLQALDALVGSGGVLVHHLQAYDMQPDTFRRILRTFAHVFPYVLVLTASPHSGDLVLIGSASPLRFRADRLRALGNMPGLDELLLEAGFDHPFDVAARVVFASRQEVLTFSQGAQPCTERHPLGVLALPQRPPMPSADAAAGARDGWREEVEAFRQRFQQMDMLREELYGLDWPHGQVCPDGPRALNCLIDGIEANDAGAEVLGELSLSLMAAGRFVEAQVTLDTAGQMGTGIVLASAREVLTLLLDDPPNLLPRLPEVAEPVRTALADNQCAEALEAANAIVGEGAEAEPRERLVAAYALVRCRPEDLSTAERVTELMSDVVSDRAFTHQHPEAFYLEARAAMVRGYYVLATWSMVEFIASARPLALERPRPTSEDSTPPEDS